MFPVCRYIIPPLFLQVAQITEDLFRTALTSTSAETPWMYLLYRNMTITKLYTPIIFFILSSFLFLRSCQPYVTRQQDCTAINHKQWEESVWGKSVDPHQTFSFKVCRADNLGLLFLLPQFSILSCICCNIHLITRDIRPRGYKTFFMLNSTEHKFSLLINVKMPTNVGILTFMSRKNSILGLSEPKIELNFLIFLYLWAFKISYSTELSTKTVL